MTENHFELKIVILQEYQKFHKKRLLLEGG